MFGCNAEMMSIFLRMSAIFVWSILAGLFITYYLDRHKLLDDQKFVSLSIIRMRLTSPFSDVKNTQVAVRKIKDNWVYDVKRKRVLFLENIQVVNNTTHLQAVLKSPVKKDQYNYIVAKLSELQLPSELALIPIIESEYNAEAVSPKGAGGLWQLMPKTAVDLGLSSEDRFQLIPSTEAALIYLKQLYKRFGSWELAIAAYNAGSSRVEKALVENPLAKSIKDLKLPAETKSYVSRFYQMQVEK